jgi:hypothetical protein
MFRECGTVQNPTGHHAWDEATGARAQPGRGAMRGVATKPMRWQRAPLDRASHQAVRTGSVRLTSRPPPSAQANRRSRFIRGVREEGQR